LSSEPGNDTLFGGIALSWGSPATRPTTPTRLRLSCRTSTPHRSIEHRGGTMMATMVTPILPLHILPAHSACASCLRILDEPSCLRIESTEAGELPDDDLPQSESSFCTAPRRALSNDLPSSSSSCPSPVKVRLHRLLRRRAGRGRRPTAHLTRRTWSSC
jgi:hypothetical protein